MNYNLLENGTTITHIDISFGNIKTIPILPLKLETLYVDNNFDLEELPRFPSTLRILSICLTGVQELVGLPDTLEELYISENPGILVDRLPPNLRIFIADLCELESIPEPLPKGLVVFSVDANYLEWLPELPETLETLVASNNQILQLPSLPIGLKVLSIQNNFIKNLPKALPPTLQDFNCAENYLKRLPWLPELVETFIFFGNPLIYEFHNKRISPKEYVNKTNKFIYLMSLSTIRNWMLRWLYRRFHQATYNAIGGLGSGLGLSSSMCSSYGSFASISSIDRWSIAEHPEDEFIFI